MDEQSKQTDEALLSSSSCAVPFTSKSKFLKEGRKILFCPSSFVRSFVTDLELETCFIALCGVVKLSLS
jgi:hypothetical protein